MPFGQLPGTPPSAAPLQLLLPLPPLPPWGQATSRPPQQASSCVVPPCARWPSQVERWTRRCRWVLGSRPPDRDLCAGAWCGLPDSSGLSGDAGGGRPWRRLCGKGSTRRDGRPCANGDGFSDRSCGGSERCSGDRNRGARQCVCACGS